MSIERVVVMGASAGGVKALEDAIGGLPSDFAAAVLVVLHMAPMQRSLLPMILRRATSLPVHEAVHGQTLEAGHVYVAVPDHHLMVSRDRVIVVRGPKENRYRPSVDVLFRSAAYHFGPGAVGVVLSGWLSDGSSGLYTIKRLGGLAVVQDPEDAAYDSMPLSALRRVEVDYAVPSRELGPLLEDVIARPAGQEAPDEAAYRRDLKLEIDISAADSAYERGLMDFGEPSRYTCPECNGVLFRIREDTIDRFRCHTGHGYSTDALLEDLTEKSESTLWEAVKSLQESAALMHEAAARLTEAGDDTGAAALLEKAGTIEQRVDSLRSLALDEGSSGEEPVEGED